MSSTEQFNPFGLSDGSIDELAADNIFTASLADNSGLKGLIKALKASSFSTPNSDDTEIDFSLEDDEETKAKRKKNQTTFDNWLLPDNTPTFPLIPPQLPTKPTAKSDPITGTAPQAKSLAFSPTPPSFAITTEGTFTVNSSSSFDINPSDIQDDALIHAAKGFTINGNPTLPVIRDAQGNPITNSNGKLTLVNNAVTVAPGYNVINASTNRYTNLLPPQVISPQSVIIPNYADIKQQELLRRTPPNANVITFNAQNNPINNANQWATKFPAGGTPNSPTVVRVINGGLNIPSNVNLNNYIITVESGDINFNGNNQNLNNTVLITNNGNINLANTTAKDLSVFASGTINTNGGARFSGNTLFANQNVNSNIIFNGATATTNPSDNLTVISAGNITYNGAANTRGAFLSAKEFTYNGASTLYGEIKAKGNIIFNGNANISAAIKDSVSPHITANLANDTGTSNTDKITFDPTITGKLTDSSLITAFKVGIDSSNSVNILDKLNPDGSFSLNRTTLEQILGGSLNDGVHTLHFVAQDLYGNTANTFDFTFTLDTTAPAAPTPTLLPESDSGISNSDRLTKITTPTIAGNSEPGTIVKLFQGSQLINQPTTAPDGTWQLVTATLADGTHVFSATATDIAGNTSPQGTPLNIKVDSLVPTLALTTPVDTAPLSAGAKLTGTVNGTGSNITSLKYHFDDLSEIPISLNSNGFDQVLDLTGISNGSHALTITAVDAAGNVKTTRYDVTVIIDTTGPEIAASLVNDTGNYNSDRITKDPTITGTVTDASGVVKLLAGFNDTARNNFIDIIANRQNDGSFTLTRTTLESIYGSSLPDGIHTLHLVAKDEVGNFSDIDYTFTLDTTPPEVENFTLHPDSDSGEIGDNQTNVETVTLVGQTEPNIEVILQQTGATVTSDSSGKFEFPDISLAMGDNSFTLQTTDIAGNSSTFNQTINRGEKEGCYFDSNLTGWTVTKSDGTGSVVAENCAAVLREGNSFDVTLSRTFEIPANSSILTFTYANLNFDAAAANQIKDAFEVALVDAAGRSLVHTIGNGETAFFNITESLTPVLAPGVTINGQTVSVDLSQLTPGTAATLQLRLVNNDSDINTNVSIKEVQINSTDAGVPPVVIPDSPNRIIASEINFNKLSDVSNSLIATYGQTSFNQDTKILSSDLTVKNDGQYPVKEKLLVGVTNISDPTVKLRNIAGTTPAGIPYLDYSFLLADGTLSPGESTQVQTLEFNNPTGVQFTYDLVFLSQVNSIPEFTTNPDTEAIVGKPYIYDVDAEDADNDSLTYSILSAPDGLAIDSATGKITWNPTASDIGNHNIIIKVKDNFGGETTQQYNLSTINPPPNRPPIFTSIPTVDANVNTPYKYEAKAKDDDGDNLTFSLVEAPVGMSVNPNTGVINWVPDGNQVGKVNIKLKVEDGAGGTAEQTYQILTQIEPGNTIPEIISQPITRFGVIGNNNNSTITLNTTVRDFKESHPDFEKNISGLTKEIVKPQLGADRIPVFSGENGRGGVTNEESFNQWYRDVPDINLKTTIPLVLTETYPGSGIYRFVNNDFFPIDDNDKLFGKERYLHNYHFTLDFHTNFTYKGGEKFRFRGDDDIWVFINNKLAVDLGGVHVPASEEVYLDSLGLTKGESYPIDFFFAERHTYGSTFDMETGLDFKPSRQYVYQLQTLDTDSEQLTYKLLTAPNGMQVNDKGTITWNPKLSQSGIHPVSVEVRDGRGGVTTQTFNLEITANGTGQIHGTLFDDANADGQLNNGETKLSGRQVYIDENSNQKFDSDEISTITDNAGNYSFTNLPEGLYNVAQVLPNSWGGTTKKRAVVVASNQTATGVDFGSVQLFAGTPNRNPNFITTAPQNVRVGQLLRYDAKAVDLDVDNLTYDLVVKPEGMTVDSNTGTVVWRPTNDQIGTSDVTLRVFDGNGGVDLQSFQVQVAPFNYQPIITSTPVTRTLVGVPYQYRLSAQDADFDSISFRLENPPSGMQVDGKGVVSWTPNQEGDRSVKIIASDGKGGEATQTYTLKVVGATDNTNPIITSTPRKDIGLGNNYFYQVKVDNADSDPLTYSLESHPVGMSIDDRGLISWQPTATQFGNNNIRIKVSDDRGGFDIQEYTVKVVSFAANQSPKIDSTPSLTATVDRSYQYNLAGSDPDGDLLLWSLDSAPRGMSIDPERGTIRWTPTAEQVGEHEVAVRVMDSLGAYVGQAFTVKVRGVNVAPTITSTPPTAAAVNKAYKYVVLAKDLENDKLQFSLHNPPSGMTINRDTGLIEWTPNNLQVGEQNVEVIVEDSEGATTKQNYKILVKETAENLPPAITSTPKNVAAVGSSYQYAVTATDPEGETPQYQLLEKPDGMTIDPVTGQLQWLPAQAGVYSVTVGAVDSAGSGGAQQFEINVAANQVPQIVSTPVESVTLGKTYRYDVKATDGNGDALVYSLTNPVAGMAIDSLGRITWSPSNTGAFPVNITVTDSRGASVSQTYNLTVAADDTAPKVSLRSNRGGSIEKGDEVSFVVSATDDVGVAATVLKVNDRVVPLDSQGRATVKMDTAGAVTAVATATDAAGNTGSASNSINVIDPSDIDAPQLEISSLEDDAIITATIDIIGTVSDSSLSYYRLLVSPVDGGEFREVFRGTSQVTNGVLGKFDPSVWGNDSYVLKLEAADASGNISSVERVVNVLSENKLGNFHLSFTDLEIPLEEIPIKITRSYDSFSATRQDDFGYGWRLEFRDTDLRANVPPDEVAEELGYYTVPFEEGTRVYLNVPGGKREVFTFKPTLDETSKFLARYLDSVSSNPESGEGLIYHPAFESMPDSTNTLSVRKDSYLTKVGNEYYGLNSEPYNPINPEFGQVYVLTTASGIVYEIDAISGDLLTATAPNGTKLTYTDAGITSSTGISIPFGRDARGRIDTVIAPDGQQIRYKYDSFGDLIAVTNRDNKTTEFVYNETDKPHHLIKVIGEDGQVKYHQVGDGTVNRPPVVTPGEVKTHRELEISVDLPKFATDLDGDSVTYSVANPVNGTVRLSSDGKKAIFTPASGATGAGSFKLMASDGKGYTNSVTMTVNISNAPLLNLDFVDRDVQLSGGESAELVVLGDFADEKDVVLPDSYVTYNSQTPGVVSVDAAGVVKGNSDGVTIVSASRDNIQAVTALRVGELPTPTDDEQFNTALAETMGLDVYPGAVTLTEGTTRKLLVGIEGTEESPDLREGATGTKYFVSNPNVLQVSPDGVVTALDEGVASVTVVHGAAEEVVPVLVDAPSIGSAVLGVDGGAVKATDGAMVMVAPGALTEDTTVSIRQLGQSELSLPVPQGFEFAGGFDLNFGDDLLDVPAQLAIPAGNLAPGTQVYFMRKGALPDETGTWKPIWLQEESGVVGDDGMIRTSSPPYPGVVRPGEYMVAYGGPTGNITLVKGKVTFTSNFSPVFFAIIDPNGEVGQLLEADSYITVASLNVSYDISSIKAIAIPKVGLPVVTELGVQRNENGVASFAASLNIPVSADSDPTAPPVLQKAELKFTDENNRPFENNEPILFLTASNVLATNLGDPVGSRIEDLVVKFYVGSRVFEQSILPNRSRSVGDNQFEVAVKVPQEVSLGASRIVLSRRQNELVSQNRTTPVYEETQLNSNSIEIENDAEYVFAALGLQGTDQVAVLDGTDPESVVQSTSSNDLLIARIPVGTAEINDKPRSLALTSNGDRAYVVLQESGRIALVDPIVLQQVDTQPDIPGINPIELPNGAFPVSIAIGPKDNYAYIGDGKKGKIYILDLNPFSPTYNQVTGTILLEGATAGLGDMAISNDGRKLFVTAPNSTTSKILVINIDPLDRPRNPSQNPRKWHEQIGSISTFSGAQGVAATPDPLKMTFTNSGSDGKGFGVLTVINDEPNSFAATVNYVPLSLGSFQDYFDVNKAVAVTLTQDGSYAFVAAKNDSLQQGVESIDGVQAGSNIGIIKDPLTPNAKLIGATRPIPQGLTTDLVLSNDNKYLYASYPTLSGGGGVYVFDVEEIIKTLSNPSQYQIDELDRGTGSPFFDAQKARNATFDDLQRVPIDDINPNVSIAADYEILQEDRPRNQFVYGVPDGTTRGPIATGGSPLGLAVSPSDWLELEDVEFVPAGDPPETTGGIRLPKLLIPFLIWTLINTLDVVEVKVTISTFPKGEGLLPGEDSFVERPLPPGLDEDKLKKPAGDVDDYNPNRVMTATWRVVDIANGLGKWEVAGRVIEELVPNNKFAADLLNLTGGQTYYWGVEAKSLTRGTIRQSDGQFYLPLASPTIPTTPTLPPAPIPTPVPTTYSSVTFLTPDGSAFDPNGLDSAKAIANSIVDNIDGQNTDGTVMQYDSISGSWQVLSGDKGLGKPLVLIGDWSLDSTADKVNSGFSEAAADSMFAALVTLNQSFGETNTTQKDALFNSPMHFIGFGRGAVVNSEIIQRLGTFFPKPENPNDDRDPNYQNRNKFPDLQMTTVDPHDFEQPSLGALRNYFDPTIQVWDNVTFADNYYQTATTSNPRGRDILNLIPPELLPPDSDTNENRPDLSVHLGGFDESGNLDSSSRAGFTQDVENGNNPHGRTVAWYGGTANLSWSKDNPLGYPIHRRSGDFSIGELFDPEFPDAKPWYTPNHTGQLVGDEDAQWAGIGTGWYYSVLGGGYYKRSLLPPVISERTPLYFDNTYEDRMRGDFAVPTVFNGNFDAIKYKIDNQPIPGWSIHNGNGVSANDVEDEALQKYLVEWNSITTLTDLYKTGIGYDPSRSNHALELGGDLKSITRNRLVVPDWGDLRFNLHVPKDALGDGKVIVTIRDTDSADNFVAQTVFLKEVAVERRTDGKDKALDDYFNPTNPESSAYLKLDFAPYGFETFQVKVPDSLRSKMVTISFDVIDHSGTAFYLDDLSFKSNNLKFGNPKPQEGSENAINRAEARYSARPFDTNPYRKELLIERPEYALSYNGEANIANWASWQLNKTWRWPADEDETFIVDNRNFKPDVTLPEKFYKVEDKDYLDEQGNAVEIDGIKYVQGHLVPVANRNRNFRDNLAISLLSNIVPQSNSSNIGAWAGFENYTTSFVARSNNKEVYIVAGTHEFKNVELPPKGNEPSPIKIPQYLWKVILVLDRPGLGIQDIGENAYTIGLWMPNDNTPARKSSWRSYVNSVDEIEDRTGYDFFSNLPLNIQNAIERNTEIRYPIDFTEDIDDLTTPLMPENG